MKYELQYLPKEKWKDTFIPIDYVSDKYLDVVVLRTEKGFKIDIEEKSYPHPVEYKPEEFDYPDLLYEDYNENASAWGIFENDELIAAIETDQELWSNRSRITVLWVKKEYRRRGIGHFLVEFAKEQARKDGRRAVILETQSCNINAIRFYMHEGFTLIGLDTCCYSNKDLERKEVRLELAWFPDI